MYLKPSIERVVRLTQNAYCVQSTANSSLLARSLGVAEFAAEDTLTKRFLVADDHAGVRRLLRSLIMQRPNWQVCGEADNGLDAVEKAKSMSPDVAVLDLAMEGLNGVEAAAAIRANCPKTMVLTVSMYDAGPLFSELQIVGVRGFISKNLLVTELLPAIDAVLTGRSWFPMQAGHSRLGDSRQHGREPSSENRKGAARSNGGRHV